MRTLIMGLALLSAAQGATAQGTAPLDANQMRGGWETTVDGVEHVYELRILGGQVSGVYRTACNDATTVAFVDGTLGGHGLSFVVTHVRDDGSTLYQDHVRGHMQHGQLIVSGHSGAPGGGDFTWTMRKDPRGKAPPAAPRPVVHYLQPGPWEPITADKLVGVWLAGSGPGKQYFIIRRDGDTLRGVVCGPCDNPYTMASLENFFIQGDTVLWNICHEDWGTGALPYPHQVVAHIAKHELRLDATQPNMQRVVSMTLFGPLPIEATAMSTPGSDAVAATDAAATATGTPR